MDRPFLIWAGSSSVGQYAIQILKYYGFSNILATASKRHHDYVKELGANQVFSHANTEVVKHILSAVSDVAIPYIYDCIVSLDGSVMPISKIAKVGSQVAVLLPIIVRSVTAESEPTFAADSKDVVS